MSQVEVTSTRMKKRVTLRQTGVAPGNTVERIVRVSQPVIKVKKIVQRGLPGADGVGGITALVDDTSPQLGSNLDLNGFQILGSLTTSQLSFDGGLVEG